MPSLPFPPIERAPPGWLTRSDYAHRGLHGLRNGRLLAENSRSAFAAAIEAGLGIECDVQISSDGQAIVFHDWVLDRMTERSGLLAGLPARDILATPLKGSEDCIESLAQLIAQVNGQVPLLVEIKSLPEFAIERACAAVAEVLSSYRHCHAVMSFDPRMGQWFARNSPETLRGLVCTDTLDVGWKGAWREKGAIDLARPDFLAIDIRDIPNDLSVAWRQEGRPVLSWTVRTRAQRAHGRLHADALIVEGEGLA